MWAVSTFNLSDVCAVREEACVWRGEMAETIQGRCSSHNHGGIIFYKTGCLQTRGEGGGGNLRVVQDID